MTKCQLKMTEFLVCVGYCCSDISRRIPVVLNNVMTNTFTLQHDDKTKRRKTEQVTYTTIDRVSNNLFVS